MKKWNSKVQDLAVPKGNIPSKLLVLAGPSGAGKTTLATLLEDAWSDYYVVTNYTTRGSRNEDPPGHFVYLDTDTFNHLRSNEYFFLCRYGEGANYGYSLEEVNLAISHSKTLVFMFRHSGIDNMLSIFQCVPTVFLTGNPEDMAEHSRASGDYNVERAKRTLDRNDRLAEMMDGRNCDYLVLENSYNGYDELKKHKMSIFHFNSPGKDGQS
jgi:guanylate kinase